MGGAQRWGFAQSLEEQLRAAHVMEGWLPSVGVGAFVRVLKILFYSGLGVKVHCNGLKVNISYGHDVH